MEPVESIDLVSNQEDDNLVESVNRWSRTFNGVGATLNLATALVKSLHLRIAELEQTNSQHENDKARLNNEIINLRTEVKEKDATINELRQNNGSREPGIQPVAGLSQQEDVDGIANVPPRIVNAVQGAVRKKRGSVANLENGGHPSRTRGGMKPIPKTRKGPKLASVRRTTRQGKHQQRISQQTPARSVIVGRMGLRSQNLARDTDAVGSRGENSGNPPQHEVVSQSHPYYRKCVCGKSYKTYKALHAHIRMCKN